MLPVHCYVITAPFADQFLAEVVTELRSRGQRAQAQLVDAAAMEAEVEVDVEVPAAAG